MVEFVVNAADFLNVLTVHKAQKPEFFVLSVSAGSVVEFYTHTETDLNVATVTFKTQLPATIKAINGDIEPMFCGKFSNLEKILRTEKKSKEIIVTITDDDTLTIKGKRSYTIAEFFGFRGKFNDVLGKFAALSGADARKYFIVNGHFESLKSYMSSDDARGHLNGVMFYSLDKNLVRLLATDGHRAIKYDVDAIAPNDDEEVSFIIPVSAVTALAKWNALSVSVSDDSHGTRDVLIESAGATKILFTESNAPTLYRNALEEVLPEDEDISYVSLDTKELLSCVTDFKKFVGAKASVDIVSEGGAGLSEITVNLSSSDAEGGVKISHDLMGFVRNRVEKFRIQVDVSLLLDVLKDVGRESRIGLFFYPSAPSLLPLQFYMMSEVHTNTEANVIRILMPMRTA